MVGGPPCRAQIEVHPESDSITKWQQIFGAYQRQTGWRKSFAFGGTPPKINGWNLKINFLKRKIIFQTFIFGIQPLIFRGVILI